MTQKDKIIKWLNHHGEITQRTAMNLGVYRLASRINEIRNDGIPIRTDMREVENKDGSTSRIAVYSYVRNEKADI